MFICVLYSPCFGNLRNHMLTHGPSAGTFEVPAAISRPWGSSILMADANGKTPTHDIDLSRSFQPLNDDLLCHVHPCSSIFHPFDRSFQALSFFWLPHHPPGCMISENSTPGIGTHFLGSAESTFANWKMAIESSLIYPTRTWWIFPVRFL